MQKRRVVIAGLARDLERIMPLTIKRIERLGRLFGDYQTVIYENDSADQTLKILKEWERQNHRVTIVSETHNDPTHRPSRNLPRARRMAYYRSQCQEVIMTDYSDFDDVILVDTDLEGGWSYDGIANTFGHNEWDFVGAFGVIFRRNGLKPNELVHYDAWAYRVDEEFTPLTTAAVNALMFDRGDDLVPVTSCFGGLGIYRMPAFCKGAYDGTDTEHVAFHRRLRDSGYRNMYLNPSQITLYGRRHRSMDKLVKRITRLPGFSQKPWHYDVEPNLVLPESERRAA